MRLLIEAKDPVGSQSDKLRIRPSVKIKGGVDFCDAVHDPGMGILLADGQESDRRKLQVGVCEPAV